MALLREAVKRTTAVNPKRQAYRNITIRRGEQIDPKALVKQGWKKVPSMSNPNSPASILVNPLGNRRAVIAPGYGVVRVHKGNTGLYGSRGAPTPGKAITAQKRAGVNLQKLGQRLNIGTAVPRVKGADTTMRVMKMESERGHVLNSLQSYSQANLRKRK